MWKFLKNYIEINKINPKSEFLKKLMLDENYENSEKKFHKIPVPMDLQIFKTSILKSSEWKNFIGEIHKKGYIYKYRWGDAEIYSMFIHLFYGDIYNLNITSPVKGIINEPSIDKIYFNCNNLNIIKYF